MSMGKSATIMLDARLMWKSSKSKLGSSKLFRSEAVSPRDGNHELDFCFIVGAVVNLRNFFVFLNERSFFTLDLKFVSFEDNRLNRDVSHIDLSLEYSTVIVSFNLDTAKRKWEIETYIFSMTCF